MWAKGLPPGSRHIAPHQTTADRRGLVHNSPPLQVNFEEYVWTASDRSGMRELGACKSGNTLDGSRWREEWTESMAHQATDLKMYIQRTAQK